MALSPYFNIRVMRLAQALTGIENTNSAKLYFLILNKAFRWRISTILAAPTPLSALGSSVLRPVLQFLPTF